MFHYRVDLRFHDFCADRFVEERDIRCRDKGRPLLDGTAIGSKSRDRA